MTHTQRPSWCSFWSLTVNAIGQSLFLLDTIRNPTMSSIRFVSALLLVAIAFLASGSSAFAPNSQVSAKTFATSTTPLMGLLDGEQERQALTRDSEPEEFFSTWVPPIPWRCSVWKGSCVRSLVSVTHIGVFYWILRNTDKMSDEEKIPIALAGLAGISLPFIAGLIALYAAQG